VAIALGTAYLFDYTFFGRVAGVTAFIGVLFLLKVITPSEVSKITSVLQPSSKETD